MVNFFLSCDWGTSAFRLRLIQAEDGSVLAETTAGKGIASVHADWQQKGLPERERISFFKDILLTQIQELGHPIPDHVPLIISGMASSSIGITELPYKDVPFHLSSDHLHVRRIEPDAKFPFGILIVSGLKTKLDVMRGEETMLIGCDIHEHDEQLILLPGTHSKHVWVKDRSLTDFKTFMTGELFDLLATKSILSNSVEPDQSDAYKSIFETGVREGVETNFLHAVFHVRTSQLFKSCSPQENYHYLSGLIIGAELKELVNSKIKIMLVCSQELYPRYWQALHKLCDGHLLKYHHADTALINGHRKLATEYF